MKALSLALMLLALPAMAQTGLPREIEFFWDDWQVSTSSLLTGSPGITGGGSFSISKAEPR